MARRLVGPAVVTYHLGDYPETFARLRALRLDTAKRQAAARDRAGRRRLGNDYNAAAYTWGEKRRNAKVG
jgi:hypothetical protein